MRNAELSLLCWVLLLIIAGLALVCAGKLATRPATQTSVNINIADASELAHALGVPLPIAQALAGERTSLRGHEYGSVHQLLHSQIIYGFAVNQETAGLLIARTPSQVQADVFWGGFAFFIAFLLVHIILRKAAPEGDPLLLPLVAFLAGVGLIAVFTVQDPLRDTFVFASQATGVAVFGALALLVPLTRPFGRLILRRYQYAYAAAGLVLVVLLILVGKGPGGVHLTLFGFEPVEVVKLLMVLFVVSFLAERRWLMGDTVSAMPRREDFAPLIGVYVVAMALFKVMNDLGPAVLLFGAFITLVYFSTGRRRYIVAGVVLLVAAGFAGYKLHMGFFATRVTMWLHPWNNPDPKGGQLADGLWGMATGGVFGSGLGLGQPGLMPRAGSDLVFATIGEELGVFGTGALLIVYSLLIARGYRIALRASTEFDRLLAVGITALLGIQTAMIMGGVTGLVPLTGMTLPFISFGSSSMVVDFFMIGLLLQISQKSTVVSVPDSPAAHWPQAIRAISLGTATYFLVGIGVLRLLPVQVFQDVATATCPLVIPEADGVSRPRMNPRLVEFAASIPRGRILDRNGQVLAIDAGADSGDGVNFLTPDGRARIYHGGACIGQLMYAVEGARRPGNPLGMDDVLSGIGDPETLLKSYRMRWLPGWKEPTGTDVVLSIDINLQRAAFDSLQRIAHGIRDSRTGEPDDRGAAVVIDGATGEVLAAVSSPSFDPMSLDHDSWDALASNSDGRAALLDRSTKGQYPPGSTFKIVTASAALAYGLSGSIFQCDHVDYIGWKPDGRPYARRRITDDEGFEPHGQTDMAKAIRVSCNVYFANMAVALGAQRLRTMAVDRYGMQHIRSVQAISDSLPDCGYGQGVIVVTPLEMACVAQTVANDGVRITPRFVKSAPAAAPASAETEANDTENQVLSPSNALALQQMMLAVTQTGTAAGVFNDLPVGVAGKTGSAQNNHGDGRTHSWFIGFAPADRPRIAFACIVENGGFGRSAAAPVCRDIIRSALSP